MVGSGGSMMASPVLEGIFENSNGVKIGGFHCRVMEVAGRLEDFKKKFGRIDLVFQHELEGHVLFVAVQNFKGSGTLTRDVTYYRREPHRFFQELPRFFSSLSCENIHAVSVSGSMGVLSMVIDFSRA